MPNASPTLCASPINAGLAMTIRMVGSLRKNISVAWSATAASTSFPPISASRGTAKPISCKAGTWQWLASNAIWQMNKRGCANSRPRPRLARSATKTRTATSSKGNYAKPTVPHATLPIPVRSGFAHTNIRARQGFSLERGIGRRSANSAMSGRKKGSRCCIRPLQPVAHPVTSIPTAGSSCGKEQRSASDATIRRSSGPSVRLFMIGTPISSWMLPMPRWNARPATFPCPSRMEVRWCNTNH